MLAERFFITNKHIYLFVTIIICAMLQFLCGDDSSSPDETLQNITTSTSISSQTFNSNQSTTLVTTTTIVINDVWTPIADYPVEARYRFSSIWTGTDLIIWGGQDTTFNLLQNGSRYNLTSNTWQTMSGSNAPSFRTDPGAIWTDDRMIIYGGSTYGSLDYKYYTPSNDTWSDYSGNNAPEHRAYHTMVWTGSKMIVWGGSYELDANPMNISNGVYTPSSNTWITVASAKKCKYHTAIWTGTEMIVWGGINNSNSYLAEGGKFNPNDNSWTDISTVNCPSARAYHTAIWTGTEMIVWGGYSGTSNLNDGKKYNPATNTWSNISTASTPSARSLHTTVWTGGDMIVWGGTEGNPTSNNSPGINSGARYVPSSDTWYPTSTTNVPTGRKLHGAVWAGNCMIITGGFDGTNALLSGAVYN